MGGYVIKIYNFNEYLSSGISYGGHGGSKKGIIINGEKWFLKYPKSTKSMQNVNLLQKRIQNESLCFILIYF